MNIINKKPLRKFVGIRNVLGSDYNVIVKLRYDLIISFIMYRFIIDFDGTSKLLAHKTKIPRKKYYLFYVK